MLKKGIFEFIKFCNGLILTIMLLTSCQTHAKMTKVKIAKAPNSTVEQTQHIALKTIEENEKLTSTTALQDLSYMTTEVKQEQLHDPVQLKKRTIKQHITYLKDKTNELKSGTTKSMKSTTNSETLKPVPPARSDAALSLLWIVVVVLVVLWLLGIISGGWGLGAFINVLLVIALILLILWLLRII